MGLRQKTVIEAALYQSKKGTIHWETAIWEDIAKRVHVYAQKALDFIRKTKSEYIRSAVNEEQMRDLLYLASVQAKYTVDLFKVPGLKEDIEYLLSEGRRNLYRETFRLLKRNEA